MKAFLIFLGLAVACGLDFQPDFIVKFGVGFDAFSRYYMTKAEAIAKGYKLTPGPKTAFLNDTRNLELFCLPEKDDKIDKALCLYMDAETGHICGMNIAILKDKLILSDDERYHFDFPVQGWTEWTVQTEDGNTNSYLAKQLLFCSSEFLKKPVEERIASRQKNKVMPEEAIWLSGFNNDLDRFPTTEAGVISSGFTKQGFFVGMGQHWYYKMTPETLCKDYCLYPWFFLTYKGEVIGCGLMIYSKMNNDFFEDPGKTAVELIVPNGPVCLPNMAENGGIRTMHFYFIDHPRLVLWPF